MDLTAALPDGVLFNQWGIDAADLLHLRSLETLTEDINDVAEYTRLRYDNL